MTAVLIVILWFGLCWTLYAYVAFPALCRLWARKQQLEAAPADHASLQLVTIIVSAYNEEQTIGARLRNLLASDYPRALLDILVVSDGSTDRTNEIASAFLQDGVILVVQQSRRGKTAGLNRAMDIARGELVVFTDANAVFSPDTVSALVRQFGDPEVGLVTGYTRYTRNAAGSVADITNVYTALERVIRRAESRAGCCVGADGAIFAVRRSLYRMLRDDDINDFVIPLTVLEQGYRCMFAEDAVCSEPPEKSLESEFRRQSRITNRTLRALWRTAHLLNPVRFPLFSFFLFSHKVARFLVPIVLACSALALLLLAAETGTYRVATIGGLFALALAAVSSTVSKLVAPPAQVGRLLNIVPAFLAVNIAILHGWWKFLSARTETTWQHDRSVG